MRYSRLATLGAIALLLLCAGSAIAATSKTTAKRTAAPKKGTGGGGSTKAVKKLELIGVANPLTVALRPCSSTEEITNESVAAGACRQDADEVSMPRLVGEEVLTVRGPSDREIKLEVSFVPDEGSGIVTFSGSADGVFLEAISPKSESPVLPLKKGELGVFRIRFRLPPGQPASAIDGSLILSGAGPSEVIRVTGALREVKELSVQPEKLTLESGDDDTEITLSGAGLIEFLRGRDFATPKTVLEGGDGETFEEFLPLVDRDNTIDASLELPSPGEVLNDGNPNWTRAKLNLVHGWIEPGTYAGTLKLSDLIPGAPAVQIELRSGREWWAMVLVVFAGVIFVGLLTQIVTYAIKRRLLLRVLAQSERAYRCVRCWPDGKTVASWNLGDLLGHSEEVDEFRLQGVRGLEQSIKTARSRADLDEDAERVLDMVARIQRWLRLEPAARRLVLVDTQANPEGKLGGTGKEKDWRESNTWRDMQVLRDLAQREPPDVKAADDLVWRLLRQADWHYRMAAVWAAAVEAEEKHRLEVVELDEALDVESKVGKRTVEEQDALDVRLDLLVSKLGLVELGDLPTPDDPHEDPEKTPEDERSGVTPVEWEASPNLFTGWATLDGKSYGQLTSKASRGAGSLGRKDLGTELHAYGAPGLAWSGAILLLTSLAYGLTKYSDTWGSDQDVLEAFLAGALGTMTIEWAALPIFQSIRLRSSKKTAKTSDEETDAAKDAGNVDSKAEDPDAGGEDQAEKPADGKEAKGDPTDLPPGDALAQLVKSSLAWLGLSGKA